MSVRAKFLSWTAVPVVAFAGLTALILSTGTPKAGELMRQATGSFAAVERGVFEFQISVTPRGSETTDQPTTIRLVGPFELVQGKKLPVARITYQLSAGGQAQSLELLTTGDKAYTVIRGQAYEMPAAAVKNLVKATKDLRKNDKSAGLSGIELNFDKWLIGPRVIEGPEIDETPTWQTSAAVDVVAAIRDLTGSARALGAVTGSALPEQLKASDVKQLRESIKNAKVDVFVGRYDHLVRKIDLSMDLVTPNSLRAAAGGVSSSRLNVSIGISKPNRPVGVKPPRDPLPYEALQSLSQGGGAATGTGATAGAGQ